LLLCAACGSERAVAEQSQPTPLEPGAPGERPLEAEPLPLGGRAAGEPLQLVPGGAASLSAPDPACAEAGCSDRQLLPALSPTDPYRQRIAVHGDTSSAQLAGWTDACNAAGPELVYELDLRAFSAPIRAHLELRGAFDGALRVEQGTPEDPFLVACNDGLLPEAKQAFLSLELSPQHYFVRVAGVTVEDQGEFELSIELPSPEGRCGALPPNDRCEQATAIDPLQAVQTFFGSTLCASDQSGPLWECGDWSYRAGEVFYALDLSAEVAPLVLHASTDLPPTDHLTALSVLREVAGTCAGATSCNAANVPGQDFADLWAKLEPGRYLLAVEGYNTEGGDFGLRVELERNACEVSNDTCATAQDIEPRLGTQTLTTWPMCGDDSSSSACSIRSPSPDIFYRLDLSAFAGPVHVRLSADRAHIDYAGLSLLDETCSADLWCGPLDTWVEPGVYHIGLVGLRDEQGPVELSVEIDTGAPPAAAACVDERVAACAAEVGCCAGDSGECALALVGCGLQAEALECVCALDPDCCRVGRSASCSELLQDCGTFCPGFDPLLFCPS
jgi:hypothetical protein